jgi:hypothetical protein
MAQVDSENSIALPVVSTRRRFLSQAAGVAAGGTALALATVSAKADAAAPVTSVASPDVDPIFALIEDHRKFQAEFAHRYDDWDLADYEAKHGERPIRPVVRTGVAVKREELDRAIWAESRSAERVSRTKPTTPAGAAALIQHVIDDEVCDEVEWHMTSLNTAVAALNSMNASARS